MKERYVRINKEGKEVRRGRPSVRHTLLLVFRLDPGPTPRVDHLSAKNIPIFPPLTTISEPPYASPFLPFSAHEASSSS